MTILNGCCNRPPDFPKSFYKELEDVLEKIHGFHLPIILLGDFNAKNKEWFAGDSTNHHGRTLKNLMDRFDMHQLVNEPTHLNNEGKRERATMKKRELRKILVHSLHDTQHAVPLWCLSLKLLAL